MTVKRWTIDEQTTVVDAEDYDALAARPADREARLAEAERALLRLTDAASDIYVGRSTEDAKVDELDCAIRLARDVLAKATTGSAEAAPDLFKSMGLPTVEVPAWEKPLRQCHHGYFGDCPKCEADSADAITTGDK